MKVPETEMTRWAVVFTDTSEMLAVRGEQHLRDAHVAYARAHPELLIGGGLKTGTDGDFCGALWIVEAADKETVEALVQSDPFYFPDYRSYEIYVWGKLLEDQTAVL